MDRAPLPAPFPVGARVRYTGDLKLHHDGATTPFFAAGSVGVVTSVRPGRRGTMRHLRDEDGPMYDDGGEPIRDTTRDGWSVIDFGNGWTRGVDADAAGYELAGDDPK